MGGRLEAKCAVVVGGGQTPGIHAAQPVEVVRLRVGSTSWVNSCSTHTAAPSGSRSRYTGLPACQTQLVLR